MALTGKQEHFVQLWYSEKNKTEAYRIAYDTENMSDAAISVEATRLSQVPKVSLRYAELQNKGQKRTETTVDTINAMYMTAFLLAKKTENIAGINQAANGLAKLHGLDAVSRIQLDKIDRDNSTDDVSPLDVTFNVVPANSDIKVTVGKAK